MSDRPIPWRGEPAPEGYHYEAVPADDWRLVEVEGKKCRGSAGRRLASCGAPAVAELLRYEYGTAGRWWAYCPDHMYGKWVEDGRVMSWITRANDEESRR